MKTTDYFQAMLETISGKRLPVPIRSILALGRCAFRSAPAAARGWRVPVFGVIAFTLIQSAALAQGIMTNGENHTGSILLAGETHSWTFDANAGDAISLSVGEVTEISGFSPWIRLRAPDGTELDSRSGPRVGQIDVLSAPQTGTYTVVVGTFDVGRDGTGTYRLTLAKTPGAFVVPSGDEGGPMTNGDNHPGEIHVGDLDQWTFQATTGDVISLSVGEVTEISGFSPWIRLRAPDGTELESRSGPRVGTDRCALRTADRNLHRGGWNIRCRQGRRRYLLDYKLTQ